VCDYFITIQILIAFYKKSVNKKRKDLSATEQLSLIDTYDKLRLRTLFQRVPQSTLLKLLKSHDMLNTNTTGENREMKCEGNCQWFGSSRPVFIMHL
jgi:hypothetical protein